jgi:hypothetical protein
MFKNLTCNQIILYSLVALIAYTMWKVNKPSVESYSSVRRLNTESNGMTDMCNYGNGEFCGADSQVCPGENRQIPYVFGKTQ